MWLLQWYSPRSCLQAPRGRRHAGYGQGREERHVHRGQLLSHRNRGYVLDFELLRKVGEGCVTRLKDVIVNSVDAIMTAVTQQLV